MGLVSMSPPETPRILAVDDNPETRLLLEHMLRDSYEVALAAGVEEALDEVASEPVDLLLLDINLGPEKNGTELLHMIRDREEGDGIPAVALTAYAMPGDREKYIEKGFDGYVSKPFARSELAETIEQNLQT